MSKADPLSAGLKSVGGRLVGLFLLMALPSLGRLIDVLSSGNYSYLPGALGGIIGAFVGVCIYFFIPLLILRFIKRGDGRPWDESCRMAFWVALAFVLIAIAGQNRGTEIPLRCSIWSSRISEKIFCSLGKQTTGIAPDIPCDGQTSTDHRYSA
jgi:hypothetical protein